MYMHMTITPVSNINFEKGSVIDNENVSTIIKDWEDKIKVKTHGKKGIEEIKVSKVSLYDNILILCGLEFKILHGLSKD